MDDAILLVDDERNLRVTLSRALEDMNLVVETAASGEEALALIAERSYSLVLLDLNLPGIGGMDVLRHALELRPGLRMIIFTAHGSVSAAVEAMKLGAVDFAEKPFTPAALRSLIGRVLHEPPGPHSAPRGRPAPGEAERFCTVIPVPDAQTAARLMTIATAPVHAYSRVYLILVQVIEVPWQTPPDLLQQMEQETVTKAEHRLLQASTTARDAGLRVRPLVLHAHSTAAVVDNLVEQEQANQVLLALNEPAPDLRSLSETQVGEVLRRVSCTVLLVRPSPKPVQHVLALVSEGPHAVEAVRQAHLLTQGAGVATLTLLHVQQEGAGMPDQGHRLIRRTAEAAGVGHDRYEGQVVEAMDIKAALETLEDTVPSFDAVFVGAARRTPLAERFFGSLPRRLAERMDGTLVIARSAKA